MLQRVVYLLLVLVMCKVSAKKDTGLNISSSIKEYDFGLIWHYSSKTSPKLGYNN